MEETISAILQTEWESFQAVQNMGGRAFCQDDGRTFEIMRKSQFLTWNREACASYLRDLVAAQKSGRNLLAEKYAHMMQRTAPLEYAKLQGSLPVLSKEAEALVEEIVAIQLEWQQAYAQTYPRLSSRSRPVGSCDDLTAGTSFETYLRGELLTYSEETLNLYAEHIKRLHAQGVNMSVQIMDHTVKMYGYTSVEKIEEELSQA